MKSSREYVAEANQKKVTIGHLFFSPVFLFIITSLLFVSIPSTALAQYTYTYTSPWTFSTCPDADKDGSPSVCDQGSLSVMSDCNDNDPYSHVLGGRNITSATLERFDISGKVMTDPWSPLLAPQPNRVQEPRGRDLSNLRITITFGGLPCGLTTPYPSYLDNIKVFYGTKNASGQELIAQLLEFGGFYQVKGTTYRASANIDMEALMETPTYGFGQIVEAAIESVTAGRPVFLKFVGTTIGSRPDTPYYYNIPDMTNCVRMSGSGSTGFVFMRGNSSKLNASSLISIGEEARQQFTLTEPFKSNQKYFSYFVDLLNHNDMSWQLEAEKDASGEKITFISYRDNPGDPSPDTVSSCGPLKRLYFFYTGGLTDLFAPNVVRAYTRGFGGRNIFMRPESFTSAYSPLVALHEAGHAFAGLRDEYLYDKSANSTSPYHKAVWNRNCSTAPSRDYFGSGSSGRFGGIDFFGCTYYKTFSGGILYRPSSNSIMGHFFPNYPTTFNKFNIVSCGYILKAINKGVTGKSYFPECAAMAAKDGSIIPVGQ